MTSSSNSEVVLKGYSFIDYKVCDLITSGFIRIHFSTSTKNAKKKKVPKILKSSVFQTMPSSILPIIIQYFIDNFEWNTKDCGMKITFSMNNTFVHSQANKNVSWIARNVMDRKQHSMIEWEVTLKIISYDNDVYDDAGICFAMGFIQHPVSDSIPDWTRNCWLGSNDIHGDHRSVTVYKSHEKFHTYFHNKNTPLTHANAVTKNVKIEDRFELRFNFDDNECSFYYNGEFMQIVFSELPETPLIPAMCCGYIHAFQTTKWNIIYRKNVQSHQE